MTERRDQDDVLQHKDKTTKSAIGLQQWDDEAPEDAIGTGSSGTSARAAKIAAGQKKKDEGER